MMGPYGRVCALLVVLTIADSSSGIRHVTAVSLSSGEVLATTLGGGITAATVRAAAGDNGGGGGGRHHDAAAVDEELLMTTAESTHARRNRRLLQSGCSTTDASAEAVLACTNAVRVNPSIMTGVVTCLTSGIQTLLTTPRRRPLRSNSLLTAAATDHTAKMVSAGVLTHLVDGEQALGSRVKAAGYNWTLVIENLAMGQLSAREVVAKWICSAGIRDSMFSCAYQDIGVGAASSYFTQVLACNQPSCNSCVAVSPSPPRPPPPRPPPPPMGPCSSINASVSAVMACLNAVRSNPNVLSDAPCFAAVQEQIRYPRRYPLPADTSLTRTAAAHNTLMVAAGVVAHQFDGEPTVGSRIRAGGYPWSSMGEIVESGFSSAREVVKKWMCTQSQRALLFSCNLAKVGVASAYSATTKTYFFTLDFGCPAGTDCYSCYPN